MPLTIRRATVADAAAVAEIHVAGWRSGYRGLVPDAHLDVMWAPDRVAGWANAIVDGPTVLVALDEGLVAGFVTCAAARDEDLPGAGEVQALYVHPDHWRRGIGELLLHEAVAELGRQGHRPQVLWTLRGNVRAQEFYERRGWAVDGAEKTDERPGLVLHELRYRLKGSTAPGPAEPRADGSGRPPTS